MWYIVLCFVCITFMTYYVKFLRIFFNRMVFNIRFYIFFTVAFFWVIIWPFPILNGRTVKNGKSWASMLKHATVLFGVKWELRNGEILAKDRGAVIVANHQSILDMIGILNIWETADKLTVLTKKEVIYAGGIGIITYFGGLTFVDRKNPKSAYKQLEIEANMINEKVKIWAFPEGTRNFDYTKFLPFKKGAFIMAVAAQAPVIPVVYSPYYFIDRKNYKLNKARAIIQCLEEISTIGLTMDDVPELLERVRSLMETAYKKLSEEVLPITSNLDNKGNVG